MTGKKDKIFLSLEKIARDTGEDEYEIIFQLAKEKGINITYKITPSLRFNQITIWVLRPYSDEEYQKLRIFFISRFPSYLVDTILHKIEKDGISYINYPEFVENWQVNDDIFEVLNEVHGIRCSELNEIEWSDIFNTKIGRSAMIQTARELVAYNIINRETEV